MSFPLGGLYISKNSKIWKEITFYLRQSLEGVETRRAWACVTPTALREGTHKGRGPTELLGNTEKRCREPSRTRTKGLTNQTDCSVPGCVCSPGPCGLSMCCCGKWSEMTCKGCPAWSQEVLNCVRDKDTTTPPPNKETLRTQFKENTAVNAQTSSQRKRHPSQFLLGGGEGRQGQSGEGHGSGATMVSSHCQAQLSAHHLATLAGISDWRAHELLTFHQEEHRGLHPLSPHAGPPSLLLNGPDSTSCTGGRIHQGAVKPKRSYRVATSGTETKETPASEEWKSAPLFEGIPTWTPTTRSKSLRGSV